MPYSKLKHFLFVILFITFAGCGKDKIIEPPPETPDIPEVTNIIPKVLYSGDEFRIEGKYFGENSFGKQVIVGDIPATISINGWSDTLIIASVEIDTGEYQVVIEFSDTTIIAGTLTYIADDVELPLQIVSISPTTLLPAELFEITGTSFGLVKGTSQVMIDNVAVETFQWENEFISCRVPADWLQEGTFEVVVQKDTEISNAVNIDILIPAPTINSITPTTAKIGDTITIVGTYFLNTQETSSVNLGSIKCEVSTWSNTNITFIVPENATTDSIKVHIGSKISNGRLLTIQVDEPPPPPGTPEIKRTNAVLDDHKTDYIPGQSIAQVFGINFGAAANSADYGKVIISPNVEATITQWRDTMVRFSVPQGAISGTIKIITKDGLTSNEYPIYIAHSNASAGSNGDRFATKYIQRGTFIMGDNNGSTSTGEAPEHQVTLTYDFYIGVTPVTREEFYIIAQWYPPSTNKYPDEPVHQLTWQQAIEFCNAFSDNAGLQRCYTISGSNITCDFSKNGYRLPTEAEWEYVARAGQTNGWGFTDSPILYTWYIENGQGMTPHRVKQRKSFGAGWPITKSPEAMYDMNGNVLEWCWDNYSTSYYQECANGVTDPRGSNDVGGRKVCRGGHFNANLDDCKATSRHSSNTIGTDYTVGFRFVRKR
ncbi:MAG: SUMF1/EgtB/PvdO family nonheme iron enzyme [Bacteroidetes bacterium]|nr:SUMF1/EgtB/PvdO family nonheme iron enzyme [Bacteroidota bacterium]